MAEGQGVGRHGVPRDTETMGRGSCLLGRKRGPQGRGHAGKRPGCRDSREGQESRGSGWAEEGGRNCVGVESGVMGPGCGGTLSWGGVNGWGQGHVAGTGHPVGGVPWGWNGGGTVGWVWDNAE